jgi:hypothetical protein
METIKIIDTNPENKRGWKIINKCEMTKDDKVFSETKTEDKPKRIKKDVGND